MRILYDEEIFTMQAFGGISRYFTRLIEFARKDPDLEIQLGVYYSKNEYIQPYLTAPANSFLSKLSFRKEKHLRHWLNRRESRRFLKKGAFDLFHPTYFNTYYLEYLQKKPFVLTIYDMIPEIFPQYFVGTEKLIIARKTLAERARTIITISENTKNDIMKHLKIPEHKIKVTYLGADKREGLLPDDLPTIPALYVLYVGARNDYKNFTVFLTALAPIMQNNKDLHLVCCGGGAFTEKELRIFSANGIAHQIIHCSGVTDAQLSCVYARATLFVFPSLYEGFGIPLLEAMVNNTPLAISDIAVFREVAGNSAFYFDPGSVSSINETLNSLLNDQTQRESLKSGYHENLQRFSWKETYNRTKEIYAASI